MNETNSNDLLCCPFCGSGAELFESDYQGDIYQPMATIACENESCEASITLPQPTVFVVMAWNRRAT